MVRQEHSERQRYGLKINRLKQRQRRRRQEHRHREKTEIHKIETVAARQAENIERYKHRNNSLKQRQTDGKAGTDRNLYIERHRHR
jgi:hypothetical protein